MTTSKPGGSLNSLIFCWKRGDFSQTSTKVSNSGLGTMLITMRFGLLEWTSYKVKLA